jgi:hypothetical protein
MRWSYTLTPAEADSHADRGATGDARIGGNGRAEAGTGIATPALEPGYPAVGRRPSAPRLSPTR